MSKSDYLEVEFLKHVFRTGSFTKPSALYVGLMLIDDVWQASTAYAEDDIIAPATANGKLFICTTAGTSDSSEPTWDTDIDATTADNTAVWTEWTSVKDAYTGTTVPEVSGGAYARVQRDPLDANWSAAVANSADIDFPTPTADWGRVGAFFIADAATNGNMLYLNVLTIPKTVNNGDAAPSFPAGTLTIAES